MAIMNGSINLVKFNKGKYRVLQPKKKHHASVQAGD